MINVRIIYTDVKGCLNVVTPAEGGRLAYGVTVEGVESRSVAPIPVDSFLRRWPVAGAVVEWAESEEKFVERVGRLTTPKGISYRVVPLSAVPSDRTFRDAWEYDEKSEVKINMDKARELHKVAMRVVRKSLLEKLDVEFMRALEAGDTTEVDRVKSEKQKLRDVTSDAGLEKATTPEELKAVWPEILKGK